MLSNKIQLSVTRESNKDADPIEQLKREMKEKGKKLDERVNKIRIKSIFIISSNNYVIIKQFIP